MGTDVKGLGGTVVVGYRYRPGGRCDLAWILLTSVDYASQCASRRVAAEIDRHRRRICAVVDCVVISPTIDRATVERNPIGKDDRVVTCSGRDVGCDACCGAIDADHVGTGAHGQEQVAKVGIGYATKPSREATGHCRACDRVVGVDARTRPVDDEVCSASTAINIDRTGNRGEQSRRADDARVADVDVVETTTTIDCSRYRYDSSLYIDRVSRSTTEDIQAGQRRCVGSKVDEDVIGTALRRIDGNRRFVGEVDSFKRVIHAAVDLHLSCHRTIDHIDRVDGGGAVDDIVRNNVEIINRLKARVVDRRRAGRSTCVSNRASATTARRADARRKVAAKRSERIARGARLSPAIVVNGNTERTTGKIDIECIVARETVHMDRRQANGCNRNRGNRASINLHFVVRAISPQQYKVSGSGSVDRPDRVVVVDRVGGAASNNAGNSCRRTDDEVERLIEFREIVVIGGNQHANRGLTWIEGQIYVSRVIVTGTQSGSILCLHECRRDDSRFSGERDNEGCCCSLHPIVWNCSNRNGRCGIIVTNNANPLRVGNHRAAGGIGQVDCERFVDFELSIAGHVHNDVRGQCAASSKRHRRCGNGGVIAICNERCPVGSRPIDRFGVRIIVATDCERVCGWASIPFEPRQIANREAREHAPAFE